MVAPVRASQNPLGASQDNTVFRVRFGGGIHTRATPDEINPREASGGQNFFLNAGNNELRKRPAFDLIGTAPNASEIRGFVTLLKSDGTVQWAVQAGDTVYEWDGLSSSGFTSIATVNSQAQLRGRLEHQWTLDDKVLVTDLNRAEVVQEWDGTTFQDVSFTDENGSGFGNFFAKYLYISGERAVFGNVEDASTATPHILVGSAVSDYTQITVSNKPSSALGEDDPFFLVMPDLKPINGLEQAFNQVAISTEKGSFWKLTGSSAKDFAFDELFPRSQASGDESVRYIGNDILYGRQGRIESLRDTDRSGDTAANDVSFWIKDVIEDYTGWTAVYNARLDRVYLFPESQSEVWVLQKDVLDRFGGEISPWVRWTTDESFAFQPTAVMNMLDPDDGLEYVFMGDSSGNIYRLEGSTDAQDAGSSNIDMQRESILFQAPLDAEAYDVDGYIRYRKDEEVTATMTLLFSGTHLSSTQFDVTLAGLQDRVVYGGSNYYNDENYYTATFQGQIVRQYFSAYGQSEEVKLNIQVDGATDFEIIEVVLRFKAAS